MDDQYKGILDKVEKALDTTGLQLGAADKERIIHSLVTQLFQRLLVVVVEKIDPANIEEFQKQIDNSFEKKDFENLLKVMNENVKDFTTVVKTEANAFLNEYISNVAAEAKK